MKLEAKWIYRQAALSWLSQCFSASHALLLNILIKFCKFSAYGLKMYPGVKWPKNVDVVDALRFFLDSSVYPLLWWLPATIAIDLLLIRPFIQLLIK